LLYFFYFVKPQTGYTFGRNIAGIVSFDGLSRDTSSSTSAEKINCSRQLSVATDDALSTDRAQSDNTLPATAARHERAQSDAPLRMRHIQPNSNRILTIIHFIRHYLGPLA